MQNPLLARATVNTAPLPQVLFSTVVLRLCSFSSGDRVPAYIKVCLASPRYPHLCLNLNQWPRSCRSRA